jgi:ABC-type phosphate transport system ATPase subunit
VRIVIRDLQTEKRVFAWIGISGCGRSASEEMQEQHHYSDYQYDVNEAAGNVKGQEPKQPKNNQDRSNYSKHVSNSFYL